jgi:DNA-binding FrmR family transcriptional regulator
MRKNTTTQRLNIIKGQIDGLINLIEKKRKLL